MWAPLQEALWEMRRGGRSTTPHYGSPPQRPFYYGVVWAPQQDPDYRWEILWANSMICIKMAGRHFGALPHAITIPAGTTKQDHNLSPQRID